MRRRVHRPIPTAAVIPPDVDGGRARSCRWCGMTAARQHTALTDHPSRVSASAGAGSPIRPVPDPPDP
ncbi:hypothetical protein Ae168Ps1_3793 [Pseudonocardia sp. Ae168_Ps1]|nr:hypothetical protein Ae150APs1_3770 [Pseudonocardia sp. Ae150A_Ps1]OLL81387.1 hypothetical protein Ae168Ps1_3793 [Pseudonocardia sp. Ae168_Ps1]OLL84499.1 hypothetical protein Ae263Ps1_1554c [Pseudonocardia sp. Ae263_Ps1]